MDDVKAITRAIASGDPGAFARLYEAKFDHVYALVRRATGKPEADCLDMVQDAMMRLIRFMKPLDDARALDAFVARVALSAAYDRLRREKRRVRREREQAMAAPGGTGASADPAAAVGESGAVDERLAWLRTQVMQMDVGAAELLRLRFGAGMTLEAIGRMVGLKPGAVDGRIGRTVGALRRAAAEEKRDE